MTFVFTIEPSAELYLEGYPAYIFDWDGSLADGHQANYARMRDALAEQDVPTSWGWFNERTGVSRGEMAVMASKEAGITFGAHAVARARDKNYRPSSTR